METVLGIQFNNFVLLAVDKMHFFSIIIQKDDLNKIHKLDDHLALGAIGESGDADQFAEFISKNIQLYKMRNGHEISPNGGATYIQRNMAQALRSRHPYHVNMLVAGFDTQTNQPELYYIDYLAALVKIPYGGHGYGAFFTAGLMDRVYNPEATEEEAVEIMKNCIAEIQKRMVINLPQFKVCIVDKDGIKHLPDIKIEPIQRNVPKVSSVPVTATIQPMQH